jgi:hypothetical protein
MKLFQGKSNSLPPSPSSRPGSQLDSTPGPEQGSSPSSTLKGLFSFTRPKTPSRSGPSEVSSPTHESGSRSPSRLKQFFSNSSPRREGSVSGIGREGSLAAGNQFDQVVHQNKQLTHQLEQERRAAEEWKARWNHQNFKVHVLTDILVVHLLKQHEPIQQPPQQPLQSKQPQRRQSDSSTQETLAPPKDNTRRVSGSMDGIINSKPQQMNKPAVFKRPVATYASDALSDFD